METINEIHKTRGGRLLSKERRYLNKYIVQPTVYKRQWIVIEVGGNHWEDVSGPAKTFVGDIRHIHIGVFSYHVGREYDSATMRYHIDI